MCTKHLNNKQQAYFSLVRPQVEYCSSIWDPRQGIENNGALIEWKWCNVVPLGGLCHATIRQLV